MSLVCGCARWLTDGDLGKLGWLQISLLQEIDLIDHRSNQEEEDYEFAQDAVCN